MSAAHTPGPWGVRARFGRLTTVIGRQRYPICDTATAPWGEAKPARDEANARLIAAAPDLLRSLVELCDQIADAEEHGDGADDDGCPICIAHADARAAIAKALGTSERQQEPREGK